MHLGNISGFRVFLHLWPLSYRRLLAPQIDPEVYPTCVGLKSMHNTVIESLWNLFQKHTGKTLKEAILKGQELHIFQPGCFYHG
jgi:hypothetical protein